jgi:putative membrane protein
VGAHYTYAEVPYEAWSEALFGASINDWLGFERNHFDRLVHFSFGLLLLPLAIELLALKVSASAATMRLLAILVVLACSALYELIEWAAALVFGGELGMAYLGTQGDEWDSHKDTALALVGAIMTAAVLALLRLQPRAERIGAAGGG